MSRWTFIQKLPDEMRKSFQEIYQNYGFYEARDILRDWIETQTWNFLNYDNPENLKFAHELMTRMISELNHASLTVNNSLKYKLEQVAHNISHQYGQDPMNFVRFMNNCLVTEMKLLHEMQGILLPIDTKPFIHPDMARMDTSYQSVNISEELKKIGHLIEETNQFVAKLTQDQEQLILRYQDRNKCQGMVQASQNTPEYGKLIKNLEQIDASLRADSDNVMRDRIVLMDRFKDSLKQLEFLQNIFEKEVQIWHRGQQESGNGMTYNGISLEELQEWCEGLADYTWQTWLQMQRLQSSGQGYNAGDLMESMNKSAAMLHRLVKKSFVIEKQPPQVMKTNTRFTSTVRLLVGSKLNIQMKPPNVSVYIISESHAQTLCASLNNPLLESAAGEILNNTGMMEYHVSTRQLTGHFRNMQLKKIKRTEKKGTESVMDEKFALLFYSHFTICGMDLGDFHVFAFSLPVVVIVHGNQEPHAHATITWDNAFAEPNRKLFQVPDSVEFARLGHVLNQKFISSVGSGLSEDNLTFLAAKALRTTNATDPRKGFITWNNFSKESLPDRTFTFWEWFYAILKLTKDHLRQLWNDKCIIGFVWRKKAEEMLAPCEAGTFLLRFSDSELGGLTVAWKTRSPDGTTDEYYMLQPFTSRDFQIRNLADRLNDLKHLTYLYPDIPKDIAFSKYYTKGENVPAIPKNGYVKPYLVTCVPGLSGPEYNMERSYPNTPQSGMQPHSPSESSMHYEPSNSQLDANCVKNGTHDDADTYHNMMDLIQVNDNIVPIDYFGYHKHH